MPTARGAAAPVAPAPPSDDDDAETASLHSHLDHGARASPAAQSWRRAAAAAAAGVGVAASASLCALSLSGTGGRVSPPAGRAARPLGDASVHGAVGLAAAEDDPIWGCGLVGKLPGISESGAATAETQRLIDGIKTSSTFNKATYWNWGLAPQTTDDGAEYLTKDFIFMPEQWGAGPVDDQYVRTAGESNFLDSNGKVCPAEMATLLLGSNEPDIKGSCMGNMFGKCAAPCTDDEVSSGDCPAAYSDISLPPAQPSAQGHCNCWEHSMATGVGFWPLEGCERPQPLPKMWEDAECVQTVMTNWKQTAASAFVKGYKYLSTPLVAVDVGYAKKFIEHSCDECQDISCGCPVYIGVHFYAYDCRPESAGGYKDFKKKLKEVADVMETYPFVKGAIMNEVGMLNCKPVDEEPICVPDGGEFPASKTPDGGCPSNDELPNGLATFIDKLFDIVIDARTSDGRAVVKGFSWFNENMAGGTYNLQLFDKNTKKVNEAGEAYIRGCTKWGEASRKAGYPFESA